MSAKLPVPGIVTHDEDDASREWFKTRRSEYRPKCPNLTHRSSRIVKIGCYRPVGWLKLRSEFYSLLTLPKSEITWIN